MKYDELVYDLSEFMTREQKMLELHLQIECQNETKLHQWQQEKEGKHDEV